MALESLPKIAPALFSAEQDLLEIYNKKSDTRGTINPSYIKSSPSGVSGAIQFSDGSALSSDSSNLFWDNVNKRFAVGTNAPNETVTIINPLSTNTTVRIGNNSGPGSGSSSSNLLFNQSDSYSTTLSLLPGGTFQIATHGNISPVTIRGNLSVNTTSSLGAILGVKGSGSTSATTSLLVQNSGATNLLEQKDDGALYVGTTASNLGVIYVPHSPTYAERTFLRMQSGGQQIFATSSNDGLVVKTLGTTFEQTITINNGFIYGKPTSTASSVSAYNLPTQINCISTANSCLINLSGGGRLQGSSDAQYIRVEGTIQVDGVSNELKGFYFNPTLTGTFSTQNVLAIHSTYGGAYLNTATPQASAILQADSTTQGFLPPRVTTIQKNAIATPANGLMVFDTDLGRPCFYNGAWVTL